MLGPGWYTDHEARCLYWVGPHVITAGTADYGWGRWRDRAGAPVEYLPPPTGARICPGARPTWSRDGYGAEAAGGSAFWLYGLGVVALLLGLSMLGGAEKHRANGRR